LSSSSTVHAHLKSIEDAGLIKREAILTRAIRIVAGTTTAFKPKKVISLPVVGTVAAGKPTLAVEDIEDTYPVPQEFLSGADGFMLRVKGDSMIEDGIYDGDFVIVRRQPSADDGDTVVAMVDGEATVKRLYREKGKIRLQPANQTMQPMYYPSIDMVGKVVGLVRRMG
jgi:repressor LexA